MRFSLSDARAVQSAGQADGRGPHPNSTPNTFEFGETEDYVQQATLAGQDGALQLHKQVIANSTPVEWLDTVTYTISIAGTTAWIRRGGPDGEIIAESPLNGDPPHLMVVAQQEAVLSGTPRFNRQ